jgi:hypothetical protein
MHVEQVDEKVVAERLWPRGEGAVPGAANIVAAAAVARSA